MTEGRLRVGRRLHRGSRRLRWALTGCLLLWGAAAAASGPAEVGLVVKGGTLVVEPSVTYVRTSAEELALEDYVFLPIPGATIEDLDRNLWSAALELRYGVTSRLTVAARLPYVWRDDEVTLRADAEGAPRETVELTGSGLGDVEFGTRYQLNRDRGRGPVFFADVWAKAPTGEHQFEIDRGADGLLEDLPTGSGFWSVRPALTAALLRYELTLFGEASYRWTVKRDFGGTHGEVDPGDVAAVRVGLDRQFLEKYGMVLAYEHGVVTRPEVDGRKVEGSETLHVGLFTVGWYYRPGGFLGWNLNLSARITQDAPSFVASFSVPLSFPLF
ncbi:MAG: hypothetical protein SCH98_10755 [Deferrisomatales bacterium]|nr:hypothetical protein [Deferrisomatales bacterium]